jgi:hypothetical protein
MILNFDRGSRRGRDGVTERLDISTVLLIGNRDGFSNRKDGATSCPCTGIPNEEHDVGEALNPRDTQPIEITQDNQQWRRMIWYCGEIGTAPRGIRVKEDEQIGHSVRIAVLRVLGERRVGEPNTNPVKSAGMAVREACPLPPS